MEKSLLVLLFSCLMSAMSVAQTVSLSSPADGATLSTVNVTLSWSGITGSSYYDYQCDTVSTFDSPALRSGYTSSGTYSASVSALFYGTTYYWRVRARTSSDTTVWSVVRSFTTHSGNITLVSPSNGAQLSTVSTTLSWNTISGSSYYDYQCDTTPNFNSPRLKSGYASSGSSSVSVSGLLYGTTYYWRIRARHSRDTAAWSTVRNFTTAAPTVTLVSPSDGAQLSTVSTTLSWNTISGSSYYDYRCDTVPTFNSGALKTGYVTSSSSSTSVSGLYYGKTYYWQIRARNSVDTTNWSVMRSFHTSNGIVTLVSPSNGAQLSTVSTTLSWNTITGSSYYDYQCDTTPNFNSPKLKSGSVSSGSSSVSVSGLLFNTTYYWRIRARNSVDTAPWSVIRTFRTQNGIITLVSPSNGANLSTVAISLSWNTITGTSYYDYRCDTVPTFNSGALKSGSVSSGSSSVSVSGLYYDKTYYWQIRSRNSSDTTAWSAAWTFHTSNGIVTLVSPSNNAQLSTVSTTLSWNTITGSSYYDYQCDTTPNFNSPKLKSGSVSSGSSSVSVSGLLFNTTYYWRIRSRNSVDTAPWSVIRTFRTQSGTITLVSPSNGANLSTVSTTLSWNTITGSSYYDYRCDTVPTFNSGALKSGSVSSGSSSVSVSGLYYDKTYYWQIRSRNSSDTTAWSAAWTFHTSNGIVTLVSPFNNAQLSTVSATLSWNTITGSSYYDYQCDTVPTFNSPVLRSGYVSSGTSSTSVSGLYYGTTYYWRVRARNSVDTSQWSVVRSFSTILLDPTLVSPSNGAYVNGVTATLSWNTISGSTYYDYRCDTVPTFNSGALKSGYVTSGTSSVIVSGLYYATTYYWKIRARNANDTTNWSAVWTFTTRPDVVTLVSPSNSAVLSTVSTTISWNTISGSTYYDYQCDTLMTFNSPGLRTGYVTSGTSSVSISGLNYGTAYYWRVRARNSVDTTQWSPFWKFATIMQDLTLVSPTNGAYVNGVTATLSWNTISGSTYYDYRCDTVPTFNSGALKSGYVTSGTSSVSVSGLYYGTTYYWEARARNAHDTTNWSSVWTFTTRPDIVTLTSPSNGATIHAVSVSLGWNTISGSTYYDYQCDTSLNFNSPLLRTGYVTSGTSSVSVSNLHYCTSYYWRVRARNSVDTTQWSNVWSFVTTDYLATAPTLISPASGSTGIPTDGQSFVWSSVNDATGYELQYSTSSNFATYTSVPVANTTTALNGLASNTTYYWRVRAYNGYGTSPWSSVWNFTTEYCYLTSSFSITECDYYTWDGIDYYASGDYTRTFTSVGGCDSTVTLHLTIHQSFSNHEYVSICASELPYTYGDTTFDIGTPSNSYAVFHYTSAHGCDSTVTLHLAVNQIVYLQEDISVCDSDLPYTYNDTVFEVGTPSFSISTFHFSSSQGCDSVVTLYLTVNPSYAMDEYVTIRENDLPYTYNDTVFGVGTTTSTFNILYSTESGCDSTVTLHLTVTPWVGVSDFADRDITCWPNPMDNQLVVSGLKVGERILFVDALGRGIMAKDASAETELFDTAELRPGIYFIVIETNDGKVAHKVIKH